MANANAQDIRPSNPSDERVENKQEQQPRTHILHTVPSGSGSPTEPGPSFDPSSQQQERQPQSTSDESLDDNVHQLRGGARGTAAMDPATRQEVARKGGLAVSRNKQHMAEIGRKGGQSVSKNREHMAKIGRKGGAASRGTRGPDEGGSTS